MGGEHSSPSSESTSRTSHSWKDEAESLAGELREQSGLSEGAPPSLVARALGYQVIMCPLPGCLGGSMPGSNKILVSPSGYRPRDELTVAHELAELALEDKVHGPNHERFCQRVAAAIILPRSVFVSSVIDCAWDLSALRRRWRYASWETIALRMADLLPGVTASKWVDGEAKWPRHPSDAERQAAEIARSRGKGVARLPDAVGMAWRLPRNGDSAEFRAIAIALRSTQAISD